MEKTQKKEEEIINLAKSGGNDASLFLLDKIYELKDELEEISKKVDEGPEIEIDEQVEKIAFKVARNLVDIEKGDKGDSYILTEDDKTEIASKVTVPVVEKVIEKTEKVIVEQPIEINKTEIVKETVEVAKYETGEEIAKKINDLPIEDGYLIDKSHIKGINKIEKDIIDLKNKPNASVIGRDVFKDIDLSSQLDGSTKTFNIMAVWNILNVSLSSYPYGALRKGIDYTWTPTSITFTDEIDASTQLSTGQKCILTVVTS